MSDNNDSTPLSLEEGARETAGADEKEIVPLDKLLPPEEPALVPVELTSELEFDSGFLQTLTDRTGTVLPKLLTEGERPRLVASELERYGHLKPLGEGGAGEVVLVHDRDITRNVAMKRLKQQDNALDVMRFVDEVQTVGALEHPNIVPIHDVGVDGGGKYYFTMKYVEGETLASIIAKLQEGDREYHRRYNFEHRTRIFLEVLHAVHYAHERGFIHRDLKPENIMVGSFGEVQVMDWGIAKRLKEPTEQEPEGEYDHVLNKLKETLHDASHSKRSFQTEHGAILGTPLYMSPEQVLGDNASIDERSDIYSLCVLFYEFLTLRHYLSEKPTLRDVLFGVLQDKPMDPERLRHPHQGAVPRELSFFLRRGLGKKPEDRFSNIQEMVEELEANLEGRMCVYCPSTLLKRGAHDYGRYLDNHRILGVVWVALLVLLSGVGVFGVVRELLGLLR